MKPSAPKSPALTAGLSKLPQQSPRSISDAFKDYSASCLEFLQKTVMGNPFIPQTPHPRQATALMVPDTELLFGGAAGGGKSSMLLMAALQFVETPGYNALLLRRTFADLEKPEALIPRSHEWLRSTAARWHGSTRSWSFPSGATLCFGYLETDNDVYQYQGAAFQFVGFDELTQFSEKQYRYLFSRVRRLAGVEVPLRMRAASNPGGIGHRWVKERFIGDNRRQGRWFIPSRLTDNPSLDANEYRKSLSHLDHITRKQLEEGDWEVIAGGLLFKRQWFNIVGARPISASRCRHWDLAATKPKAGKDPDWTSGTLMSMDGDGKFCIEDIKRTQDTPLEVEKLIYQTAQTDGRDVMISMEQEPGAGGVNTIDHYARVVLCGFNFRKDKPMTNKAARAKPLSAAAEAGNVSMLRGPWNVALLDELELFPMGDHDDQCLVGDTTIITTSGIRRLDEVQTGSVVLGRSGWTRVLSAFCSGIRRVIRRGPLCGTVNHPVFTEGEFIPLARLEHTMLVSIPCAKLLDVFDRKSLAACAGCITKDGITAEMSAALHRFAADRSQSVRLLDAESRCEAIRFAPNTTPDSSGTALRSQYWLRNEEQFASRRLCSTGLFSAATQTLARRLIEDISNLEDSILSAESSPCIRRFGSQSTGRFHRDIACITSAGSMTTAFQALNSSPKKNMGNAIESTGRDMGGQKNNSRTSLVFDTLPSRGTNPRRGESGTRNTHWNHFTRRVFNLTTEDGTYFANGILVHNCDSTSGAHQMLTAGQTQYEAVNVMRKRRERGVFA